jgi:hypothetical protein
MLNLMQEFSRVGYDVYACERPINLKFDGNIIQTIVRACMTEE